MAKETQKILVIKLGALGDFIQALGPMAAIRKHHEQGRVTLLTTKPFEDLAQKSGYFDHIWIDKKPRWRDWRGWLTLRKKLASENFDRVYDLQNNDRTNFYYQLFWGAKKPEWSGTAYGASHRNPSKQRTAGHAFDGHVQTLSLAGIKNIKPDSLDWLSSDISRFGLKQPYVLLFPGSAPNRLEKRWDIKKFSRLACLLSEEGLTPVVIGTGKERNLSIKICEDCPHAKDLTGQTNLEDIANLAKNAHAAIGNDTGPLHISAVTNCPTVALFSKHSDPERHYPMGTHVDIIMPEKFETITAQEVIGRLKKCAKG